MPVHEPPLLLENAAPRTQPRASGAVAVVVGGLCVGLGVFAGLAGSGRVLAAAERDFTFEMLVAIGWMPFGMGLLLIEAGLRDIVYTIRRKRSEKLVPNEPWRYDFPWRPDGISDEPWRGVTEPLRFAFAAAFFLAPFHYWAFGPEGNRFVKVCVGVFDAVLVACLGSAALSLWRWMIHGQRRLRFRRFPFFMGVPLRADVELPRGTDRTQKFTATLRCIQERYIETNSGEDTEHSTICEALYTDSMELPAPVDRSVVPVDFPLPVMDGETRLSVRPPRYWTLTLESGGHPLATFLVPVYRAPRFESPFDGQTETCELDFTDETAKDAPPPRATESLGTYGLTILARLLEGCRTIEELRARIDAYPENIQREGRLKDPLLSYIAHFTTFAALRQTIWDEVMSQGGQASLDADQAAMDRDEFHSGWDEKQG